SLMIRLSGLYVAKSMFSVSRLHSPPVVAPGAGSLPTWAFSPAAQLLSIRAAANDAAVTDSAVRIFMISPVVSGDRSVARGWVDAGASGGGSGGEADGRTAGLRWRGRGRPAGPRGGSARRGRRAAARAARRGAHRHGPAGGCPARS